MTAEFTLGALRGILQHHQPSQLWQRLRWQSVRSLDLRKAHWIPGRSRRGLDHTQLIPGAVRGTIQFDSRKDQRVNGIPCTLSYNDDEIAKLVIVIAGVPYRLTPKSGDALLCGTFVMDVPGIRFA